MSKVLHEKYVVKEDDLLLKFLRESIQSKSKNNLKSFLAKEKITINGVIETRYNFPVKKGDIVEIRNTSIKNTKYNEKIEIIYEDDDIIVVNKPAGLLTVGTQKEKKKTAYNMIREYLRKIDKNNKVFVIHRLDKATSGVVIFAKSMEVKNLFQNSWNKNVLNREYTAVVEGVIKNDKKVIKSYLKENSEGFVYSSNKPNDGKLAITCYEKINVNKRYTMLKINIKTGRKNQIRVHMKEINHPIVGDTKYGSGVDPVKRLCLHANKLEIINPINNKKMIFESKVPFELYALL